MSYFEERGIELSEIQNIYNDEPSDMIYKLSTVPEILRLNNISMNSGTSLSKFGMCNYKYTMLDHSIGVALLLEKLRKDSTQIIAGLLSNINSPAYNRATELMKQDISEYTSFDQIVGSDMLFDLFLKNQISINDIADPTIYPLISSKSKQLDVRKLEKMLHFAYFEKLCGLDEINEICNDIIIVPNEDKQPELAFETPTCGIKFSRISIELGKKFRSYEAKITMQIISDLLDLMIRRMEINPKDLYKYGDRAILEIGINSSDRQISDGWKYLLQLDKVYTRFTPIEGEYCKKIIMSNEYIDPLVRVKGGYDRASKCDTSLAKEKEAYDNSDTDLYAYVQELEFLR